MIIIIRWNHEGHLPTTWRGLYEYRVILSLNEVVVADVLRILWYEKRWRRCFLHGQFQPHQKIVLGVVSMPRCIEWCFLFGHCIYYRHKWP